MEGVEVPDLGRASILTLMVKQILDRSLQNPRKRLLLRNRILTVQIKVRRMFTTLFFESGRIRAEDGARGRPNIEISGDMQTLLSVALGGHPLAAILKGRLNVRLHGWRGWFYAPRFLPLMQLAENRRTPASGNGQGRGTYGQGSRREEAAHDPGGARHAPGR